MHSSTSNSDSTSTSLRDVVAILVREALPSIVVSGLVLTAAGLVHRASHSPPSPEGIEGVIVEAQMARAKAGLHADILVAGDSSGLMDIDPVRLSERLGGTPVESLATIGFVGPAGFGKLLGEYTEHAPPVQTLILALNRASFGVVDAEYRNQGFESRVLDDTNPADRSLGLVTLGRLELYDQGVRRFVAFPLPGNYGRFYGTTYDLQRALYEGHGGLTDPNTYQRPDSPARSPFDLSPAFTQRLPALRTAIERAGFAHVWIALTPIPRSAAAGETLVRRDALAEELLATLDLPRSALAPLPATLSDDMFATSTHLASSGRRAYTDLIADWLAVRPASAH